jgi:drug/metabolite transporter (DMT)-like permease
MFNLRTLLGYLFVSVLWGCTNPFIKHAQSASNKDSKEGTKSTIAMLKKFSRDYKMLVPFFINQCGSLMFYFLLSTEPVSVASPVCNSLTFLFTAITSYFVFNETVQYPMLLIGGTFFIIAGTALCLAG